MHWRVRRMVSLYSCHFSPKAAQFKCQEKLAQPTMDPSGELGACKWVISSLCCATCCQRGPFPSHSIQNTEVCYIAGWVCREWLGDSNQGSWRAFKGTETLKTISWTSGRSPFMNHGGLPWLQVWPTNPQAFSILHITHPYTPLPVASFLCMLSIALRASEHMQ